MFQCSSNVSVGQSGLTVLPDAAKFAKNSLSEVSQKRFSLADSFLTPSKLDEKTFAVIEEETTPHSAEQTSESEGSDEHEIDSHNCSALDSPRSDSKCGETAIRIRFCVEDEPAFSIKNPDLLPNRCNKVCNQTPFFHVRMLDPVDPTTFQAIFYLMQKVKVQHIRNLPVELVQKALESTPHIVDIEVDNGESVTIEFTADEGGLTEDQVNEKMTRIAMGLGFEKIKIKSDEDMIYYQENTVLSY